MIVRLRMQINYDSNEEMLIFKEGVHNSHNIEDCIALIFRCNRRMRLLECFVDFYIIVVEISTVQIKLSWVMINQFRFVVGKLNSALEN